MTTSFTRRDGLLTRWFEGEAFVITPHAIENLTPMAALVWRLIGTGSTEGAICGKLQQLYPDVEPARIGEDVRRLLRHFESRKLLQRVSAPAARKAARRRSTRH